MLTVAIQAGGESRRMGQDKALIPFLGQPLIQRVVRRLQPIADETVVTTNQPANFAFLGLPLFSDEYPGCGPLGGLFTSLSAASHSAVGIAGCDMPFVSPDLLAYQAQLLEAETADIVIPLSKDGYEPLHAVYRRETCLPVVKWALENAQWKLIAWFSKVKVRALTLDECRQYDPTGLAFTNINTPMGLAEAEELARRTNR
jgi:molybdopterin-guanine dinucleotide biosynthesis protein A